MLKKNLIRVLLILLILLISYFFSIAGASNGIQIGGIPAFTLMFVLIFTIQYLMFLVSFYLKTDTFFDITGSITYIILMISSYIIGGNGDLRSLILMSIIVLWAVRLGMFLFTRVHRTGGDKRFIEIKKSFFSFMLTWSLQGIWVLICTGVALTVILSETKTEMGLIGMLGLLCWIFGFYLEVIADYQKYIFRKDQSNQDKFITTGLWAWSRHPNYFGEILLWFGVTIIAFPALQGLQLITIVSPIFVTLLLTKISGINLLEKSNYEKWGDNEEFLNYMENTPRLIIRPPKKIN